MALSQIAWVEGASLHVDLSPSGVVVGVECWAPPDRACEVTVTRNGNDIGRNVIVAAGTTRRWDLPNNRRWTYDDVAATGFEARLRVV